MIRVLVPLANGFEEVEATTIVDVLRRADIEVVVAALDAVWVTGSHRITLQADCLLDAVLTDEFDALVLPGGLPGAHHLRDDPRVLELVRRQHRAGKWLAAICAAPVVLEAAGVLHGKQATSYPDCELPSARYSEEPVVRDGHIVTSRGVGTALAFALELVSALRSESTALELGQRMLVRL